MWQAVKSGGCDALRWEKGEVGDIDELTEFVREEGDGKG